MSIHQKIDSRCLDFWAQYIIYVLLLIFSIFLTEARAEDLPDDLVWETNDYDPVFSSNEAQKGGTLHLSIPSFPMTFRVVGPDSNGAFRSAILDNQLGLIGIHPDTLNIIPAIATHWAFGKDKRTMFFKLNKDAKWSDGKPVTAEDFAFTLEFMRSEYIIAPWYNDYYTKEIEKVIIYDPYTLAVVSTKPVPDLHLKLSIIPTPKHYYGRLEEGFVERYNWKIVPNTGPYRIYEFRKGKNIKFERKKDWWGKELRYFKNRFNVDRVIFGVIRDFNMNWEYFKKGKSDCFPLNFPEFWHVKSDTDVFQKGYINKIWFFNDTQRSAQGMWLNCDKEIFADKNVRYAFAHAMNIEKVISEVLRNDYFRLEQAYIGYGLYTNKNIKARRFDMEKVDFYMKRAGWERGEDGIWTKDKKRYSVEVIYGTEAYSQRLVVLKEEAKRAGIELRIQRMDSSAFFKKILEKKHDVAWMGWSTSLTPHYWEFFHSVNAHKPQTNNITNTDDPEIDSLIDSFRESLDKKERIALSLRIQEEVADAGVFVPTFMTPYIRQAYWRWLRLPDIHGTKKTTDLFDPFSSETGGLFWFDKDVYEETKKAMKAGKSFEPVTIIDDKYKN